MNYLLYDNNCPFCCKIVSKLSSLIDSPNISYIHLKSLEGQKLINKYSLKDINSVIYINHNKVFIKSNAILNMCKLMNFPYKLLYILNVVPKSALNIGYDFIAKNRMSIKI
jgi:predicted DCC family thiol-disulfide oxidoreductase YuxK